MKNIILIALTLLIIIVGWGIFISTKQLSEPYTVYIFEGKTSSWEARLEIVESKREYENRKDKLTLIILSGNISESTIISYEIDGQHKDEIKPDTHRQAEIMLNGLEEIIKRDESGFPQSIHLQLSWDNQTDLIQLEYLTAISRRK